MKKQVSGRVVAFVLGVVGILSVASIALAAWPYNILMIDPSSGSATVLWISGTPNIGDSLVYDGPGSGGEQAKWQALSVSTGTLVSTKTATGPQTTSAVTNITGLASDSYAATTHVDVECQYPYNFAGTLTSVTFPFTLPSGATMDSISITAVTAAGGLVGVAGTTLGGLVGANGQVALVKLDVYYGANAGSIVPRFGATGGIGPSITLGPSGLKYSCEYTAS